MKQPLYLSLALLATACSPGLLLAAPGQKRPVAAPEAQQSLYRFHSPDQLTPLPSGPGLVVFPPALPKDAGEELRDFTAAAAHWLQIHAAGQPAFRKTPTWDLPEGVAKSLGYPGMRLSAAQAGAVCNASGTTHGAVGNLTAAGTKLTLSYQVVQALPHRKKGKPAWRVVGTPIRVTGEAAQVGAALPRLARGLIQRLGGKEVAAIPRSLRRTWCSWERPLEANGTDCRRRNWLTSIGCGRRNPSRAP